MEELYKKMYLHLFNAITDALRALEEGRALDARRRLMDAQCETEEMYISYEEVKEP